MNKLTLCLLFVSSFSMFAMGPINPDEMPLYLPDIEQYEYEQSLRTDRIKVRPLAQINMPEKEETMRRFEEQKEQGYFLSSSNEPKKLMAMSLQTPENGRRSITDTGLQKNIQDVALLFNLKSEPDASSTVIGYAPMGMWKETGWTGVTAYFKDTVLGVCEYSLMNIALSHGGAIIAEEHARYDVNKKLTTVDVKGSPESGFLYDVSWFDNNFIHELECTQTTYDAKLVDHMITWAEAHDQ